MSWSFDQAHSPFQTHACPGRLNHIVRKHTYCHRFSYHHMAMIIAFLKGVCVWEREREKTDHRAPAASTRRKSRVEVHSYTAKHIPQRSNNMISVSPKATLPRTSCGIPLLTGSTSSVQRRKLSCTCLLARTWPAVEYYLQGTWILITPHQKITVCKFWTVYAQKARKKYLNKKVILFLLRIHAFVGQKVAPVTVAVAVGIAYSSFQTHSKDFLNTGVPELQIF